MDRHGQLLLKLSNNLAETLTRDEEIIRDVYDNSTESLFRQSYNVALDLDRINDDLDTLSELKKYSKVSPKMKLADVLKRYNEAISKVENWQSIKKRLEVKQHNERNQHYKNVMQMTDSINKMISHLERLYLDLEFSQIKGDLNKLRIKLQKSVGELAKDLSWLKK